MAKLFTLTMLVAALIMVAAARDITEGGQRGLAIDANGASGTDAGQNGRKLQVPGGLNYVGHYDICYNPWGVFQCCADTGVYCFKHNEYYSQCITPDECMNVIKNADQCAKRFTCGTGDGTGR